MTAQELKNKYPIYPAVKVRHYSSGEHFVGETLVRKKFNNQWYLFIVRERGETETDAKWKIDSAGKIHLESAEYVHPDSPMGRAMPDCQVLDDNQND